MRFTVALYLSLAAHCSPWNGVRRVPLGGSVEWPPEGTNCTKGPCGPGNDVCVNPGDPQQYTFHLSDKSCTINDPNGPFYDEKHGMYHLFYQIHLAEPSPVGLNAGAGPDWGHWVSRDFVKWARLPVAVWNTEWYDNAAIFTGSTTIVDGRPVIVYPGKCRTKPGTPVADGCHPGGGGGFTYAVALPANDSDPFLTNWTKPSYNPIVNQTGDDPSTAWKTPDGEWRLIGNQGCSDDASGNSGAPIYGSMDFKTWYKIGCTELLLGDCPTFFPLPALTPGSSAQGPLPNYVHKAGSPHDLIQVGTWTDGKPGADGTPGTWVPSGGSVPLDNGRTHASKDFFDPVAKRRIMWVWGTLPNGVQTIPRVMTYDPRFNKIVYTPAEEIEKLRGDVLDNIENRDVDPKQTSPTLKASSASEISVTFAKPTAATTLLVELLGGSTQFYINFVPNATEVEAGVIGKSTDVVSMTDEDEEVTIRVFQDTVMAEVYFMGGRVAMTEQVTPGDNWDVSVATTDAPVTIKSATVWQMGSIWTTPEEVLRTPRKDGRPL